MAQPLAHIALDVPGNMRSLIEKKLSLLTEQQRQIMLCASIEGEEFSSNVLAALLEKSELEIEGELHTIQKMHRLIWLEGEQELPEVLLPRGIGLLTPCISTTRTLSC